MELKMSDSDFELEIEGEELGLQTTSLAQKIQEEGKRGSVKDPAANMDEIDALFSEWEPYFPFVCKLTLDDIGVEQNIKKIYQIQILKDKGGLYGLFCKWSNVAGKFDYSMNKTESCEEAVNNFKEKFFEKTFNQWDARDTFRIYPGSYMWIGNYKDQRANQMDIEHNPIRDQLKEKIKLVFLRMRTQISSLPKGISGLLVAIFDMEEAQEIMDNYSINKTRLTMLDIEVKMLLQAFKILSDIEYQIFSPQRKRQKIFELSSEFNELIPQTYKMAQNQMIDEAAKLRSATRLVKSLMGIQAMTSLIKSLEYTEASTENPLDQIYRKMNCRITPLDAGNSLVYDTILKMTSSHAANHQSMKIEVLEVFQIEKEGEIQAFWPFRHMKRRMLWFGAPSSKIIECLEQGIKQLKSESPGSTDFFGRGHYFTDVFSKAVKGCGHEHGQRTGYLLLCDVAVGKEYCMENAKVFPKAPKGHHSIRGAGKFQCTQEGQIDGSSCSIGVPEKEELWKDSTFVLNEFAVFDDSQIKMSFLVKVGINY